MSTVRHSSTMAPRPWHGDTIALTFTPAKCGKSNPGRVLRQFRLLSFRISEQDSLAIDSLSWPEYTRFRFGSVLGSAPFVGAGTFSARTGAALWSGPSCWFYS